MFPDHPPSADAGVTQPRDVLPIGGDLGVALGHRLVVLSLERWSKWADLRFARIDVEQRHRLTRRVPADDAWTVTWRATKQSPAVSVEVREVVGRGDRAFSNGEVRLAIPPASDGLSRGELTVSVVLAPGASALEMTIDLESQPT